MGEELVNLGVLFDFGDEVDAAERDELIRSLAEELREADVEQVRIERAGEDVVGAKGGGATLTQVITAASSGAVPAVVAFVNTWYQRRKPSCQLTIDLGGGKRLDLPVDVAEARRLIGELGPS